MPRYMLDTDTCSYVMKRSNGAVLKRLSALPVSDVCISVITKSELLFGVEVSPRRRQDAAALSAFLQRGVAGRPEGKCGERRDVSLLPGLMPCLFDTPNRPF